MPFTESSPSDPPNHAPRPTSNWRVRLSVWLAMPAVQHTVLALIVLNAVILGLQTSVAVVARWGSVLQTVDHAILAMFVIEIAARIAVLRGAFFRNPWGVFDFIVVAIALVPASGPFAVLRALRVLRVLRILTIVPSMRQVVGGLLGAIPGLASIGAVMGLIFYVMAVIATNLFGADFPEWFGGLGRSLYTLFQVMTLESWSMGIVRPVMEQHPYAWLFFIVFILIATFTMLNLFIGVIVGAMQTFREADEKKQTAQAIADGTAGTPSTEPTMADLMLELRALRGEVAALQQVQPNAFAGRSPNGPTRP